MDATENAVITVPIARPRRSGGTTSLTMASATAVAGPPNAPAKRRAAMSEPDGNAAERRRDDEAQHGGGERLSPIETIEKERAGDAGNRCGERVGAAEVTDVRHRDVERFRKIGPERHDHHEVEDVDELHCGDEQHDRSFADSAHAHARRRAFGRDDRHCAVVRSWRCKDSR
jgi:hypothetical protein